MNMLESNIKKLKVFMNKPEVKNKNTGATENFHFFIPSV